MQRGGISSTIRSANGPPPSAEGGKGWRQSRHKLLLRVFQTRPKGFAIALWKPSPPAYRLVPYPTLAGRGGSVSRRDHNPKTKNRAQLTWARKSEGTHKPIPSYSSGEGVWGRGASLREAASPPESPPYPASSLEEGARGRGLFFRKGLSLAYFTFISLLTFVRNQTTLIKSDFGLGGMK